MNKKWLCFGVVAMESLLGNAAHAADIRFNGFASVVGGVTTSSGITRNPYTGEESDSTYSDFSTAFGTPYNDTWSFRPDTVYGLQIKSDFGNDLSATGLITGHGGEDFDAEIAWAYLSYNVSPSVTLQVGRQRLPLFYYSDFIDVGYSYHWIRIPNTLASTQIDTYEGLNLSWTKAYGNWSLYTKVFAGASKEYIEQVEADTEAQDILGLVAKLNGNWLSLRASYTEFSLGFDTALLLDENFEPGDLENPINVETYDIATQLTLGDTLIAMEYTFTETDRIIGFAGDAFGTDGVDSGWYISLAQTMGSFTPHITYGQYTDEKTVQSYPDGGIDEAWKSITVGLRWDFHPSAALKLEYTSQSDESDTEVKENFGAGGVAAGFGERYEVDLFSFGIDVVF